MSYDTLMHEHNQATIGRLRTEIAVLRGVAFGFRSRAEKAEAELAALRADRDALARDFADLLVLADLTAQVEARSERLAAIQKRYILDAARKEAP